jgi:hypothetical protein
LTLLELMKAAAAKWDFRPLGAEDPAQYREALIRHVRSRDYAMAHELRVGRAQADWTTEDVRLFKESMMAMQGPPRDALSDLAQPMMETGRFTGPLTVDMVFEMARRMLHWFKQERRKAPQREFRPKIDLLLMDGRTLATEVNRGERIAVLKTLAQELPVYGFVIGFDAYAHILAQDNSKAEKVDCIIVHVGTRDVRVTKVWPYHYQPNGTVVFDNEPKPDLDFKGDGAHDPYAEIFVSVPTSKTAQ